MKSDASPPVRTVQPVWPDGLTPASLLYVPASKGNAVAKVASRGAEAVILDLEDGVAPGDRAGARALLPRMIADTGAPLEALAAAGRLWIRPSTTGPDAASDLAAINGLPSSIRFGLVIPKAEAPEQLSPYSGTGRPLLPMIETPMGVLNAHRIASVGGVAGLVAGLNDLAHMLRLPAGAMRTGTMTALSQMVIAARAAGTAIFDGVWNDFGDVDGFAADTAVGRSLGCDGRTLIHPSQVAPCHAVYGPSAAEIAHAELVLGSASATDGEGAIRMGDRMVEDMHRADARLLLSTARARGLYPRE